MSAKLLKVAGIVLALLLMADWGKEKIVKKEVDEHV